MKSKVYIIFLCFFTHFSFSQSGEIYYKKKLISSENSTNQIVLQAIKQLNELEFKLIFDPRFAHYRKINIMTVENTNPVVQSFANSFSGFRGEAYFERDKSIVILKKEVSDKTFLVIKNKVNWKLSKDTLKIGNYVCYKATTIKTIKNSDGVHKLNVIAWYTPEIPLPYGPDGYGGLPGVILQLEDNGTVTFVDNIKFSSDSKITLPLEGEKISEDEYEKLILNKFEKRKG